MQQAADLQPDNVQHKIDIADIYMRTGDYSAALVTLRAVLTKNPTNAEALSRQGDISLVASEPAAALDYYQRALVQILSFRALSWELRKRSRISDGSMMACQF